MIQKNHGSDCYNLWKWIRNLVCHFHLSSPLELCRNASPGNMDFDSFAIFRQKHNCINVELPYIELQGERSIKVLSKDWNDHPTETPNSNKRQKCDVGCSSMHQKVQLADNIPRKMFYSLSLELWQTVMMKNGCFKHLADDGKLVGTFEEFENSAKVHDVWWVTYQCTTLQWAGTTMLWSQRWVVYNT